MSARAQDKSAATMISRATLPESTALPRAPAEPLSLASAVAARESSRTASHILLAMMPAAQSFHRVGAEVATSPPCQVSIRSEQAAA